MLGLLVGPGALAVPTAHLQAQVSADLRTVTGTLELQGHTGTVVDPLARLPDPPDDRHRLRTFPGRVNHGVVRFEAEGPGRWSFEAELPRRYGDVGFTREGLLANGYWYPQPLDEQGALCVVDWTVSVTLPERAAGALGDTAGTGTLTWAGRSDRASLGLLRRGRVTRLDTDAGTAALVTPRRPRRRLLQETERALALLKAEDLGVQGVLIEGPLRRRLVRPGSGLAYVSDRTFRLTPPMHSFHRVAYARGLAAAWSGRSDSWERTLTGAAAGQVVAEALTGVEPEGLLRTFRWVPQIHWLLIRGTMPFYGDILQRAHPSDLLADDLHEVFEPTAPSGVVVAQVAAQVDPTAVPRLGQALMSGSPLDQAAADASLPAGWLESWRVPYPTQDWQIAVDRSQGEILVMREAPSWAPPEVAVLRLDQQDLPVLLSPGEEARLDLAEGVRRVTLDPNRLLAQSSLRRDHWPARYSVTLSAGISTVNLTQMRLFGAGAITLRRSWDSHNLVRGVIYNSFSDLVGAQVSWMHQEGPQQDGWSRPHRWSVWISSSLLNNKFAATDGLQPTLGAGTAYTWDTRTYSEFPLRGHGIAWWVGGGVVPGLDERWLNTGPGATVVLSPHPRVALATKANGELSRSNVPHRRLALGGSAAMRSLPALPACPAVDANGAPLPCQDLADLRGFGTTELRVAPLRNVSVPLPLAWGSELQLTAGFEAVVGRLSTGSATATGVTFGIAGIADILGAEPTMGGLTLGWPLTWSENIGWVERSPWPEVFLRWSQEF